MSFGFYSTQLTVTNHSVGVIEGPPRLVVAGIHSINTIKDKVQWLACFYLQKMMFIFWNALYTLCPWIWSYLWLAFLLAFFFLYSLAGYGPLCHNCNIFLQKRKVHMFIFLDALHFVSTASAIDC